MSVNYDSIKAIVKLYHLISQNISNYSYPPDQLELKCQGLLNDITRDNFNFFYYHYLLVLISWAAN